MKPQTDTQRRLAILAAALADANADAAGELGRLLVAAEAERKKVAGFGIEIRWNSVTQKAEVRGPESPAKGLRL